MLYHFYQDKAIEAGCDEAGRGCLAGPVFAAAVILPKNFYHPLLNDSKKVTAIHRNELKPIIEEKALAWFVSMADHLEIDEINILNASFLAMHRAISGLKITPSFLIIDGNRFKPYKKIPHQCIVEGDAKYSSIAAASILAKTYRDHYMQKLHAEYPNYGWNKNKGYGTTEHRNAIRQFGITELHRKSFRLLPDQLEIPY